MENLKYFDKMCTGCNSFVKAANIYAGNPMARPTFRAACGRLWRGMKCPDCIAKYCNARVQIRRERQAAKLAKEREAIRLVREESERRLRAMSQLTISDIEQRFL